MKKAANIKKKKNTLEQLRKPWRTDFQGHLKNDKKVWLPGNKIKEIGGSRQ